MLGKAHITVGMASALTLMMPESMPAALPVVAGAAAGCLICDIDCDSPREKSDASKHRALAMIIACIALAADFMYWKGDSAEMQQVAGDSVGMWQAAAGNWPYMVCAGVAGLALTLAFANVSSHRGFSHSLLAMALEAGFLWMIFPQTALPFVISFASHLVLDLLNKKPVRLFYPAKKGFCLGLFYADRLANKLVAAGGAVWLIVIALMCLRK